MTKRIDITQDLLGKLEFEENLLIIITKSRGTIRDVHYVSLNAGVSKFVFIYSFSSITVFF